MLGFYERELRGEVTSRRESGLYVVETPSPETLETRRFFETEFRPVAERTDRFHDLRQGESFPYVGGTLLSHTVDLVRRMALTVPLVNALRRRLGQPLIKDEAAIFDATFEDLDEVDRENPHPDEATNGKSHNHREQTLAQFRCNVDRAQSVELQQRLIRRIGPMIEKVPTSALPEESQLVKLLEDQQHAVENGLYPYIDLMHGHQQLTYQHELVFDVGWHVLERLLRDGKKFPPVLEPLRRYRQEFIELVEHYYSDVEIVAGFIETLTSINPNRSYPDTDEIVARMGRVLDELARLPELKSFVPLQSLREDSLTSVDQAS